MMIYKGPDTRMPPAQPNCAEIIHPSVHLSDRLVCLRVFLRSDLQFYSETQTLDVTDAAMRRRGESKREIKASSVSGCCVGVRGLVQWRFGKQPPLRHQSAEGEACVSGQVRRIHFAMPDSPCKKAEK